MLNDIVPFLSEQTAMAASLASCLSPFRSSTTAFNSEHLNSPFSGLVLNAKSYPEKQNFRRFYPRELRVRTVNAKKSSKPKEEADNDSSVPSWARPDSDELPPWARKEAQKDSSSFEVPFIVYLLASAIVAIAAIGSIFEYANQKPVFGVLDPDSVFYAPLLGFFVFTGIPFSGFLWYKSVQVANKEAEDQDRRDGYL